MKRLYSAVLACLLLVAGVGRASRQLPPQCIMDKVHEAVQYLAAHKNGGLAAFNDPEGPWTFNGTYIFVFNCQKEIIAAHPSAELRGWDLKNLVDIHGDYLGLAMCQAAKKPEGGWVEYWWPRLGGRHPERKASYILQVPGLPYAVGAGIYADDPLERPLPEPEPVPDKP